MTPSPRMVTIECPRCRQEYEDRHRPSVNLALEDEGDEHQASVGVSACPSCGFRIRRGMMIVREEDGVWIVEADGE